jgi:transposase
VAALCERVPQATGQRVEVAYVDQGYTGQEAEYAVAIHDIDLQVVAKPAGQTGGVLLPRRWVVERSFGWAARFRRLARDYERLALTMQQFHFLVFVGLLLARGVFQLPVHNSLYTASRASTPPIGNSLRTQFLSKPDSCVAQQVAIVPIHRCTTCV